MKGGDMIRTKIDEAIEKKDWQELKVLVKQNLCTIPTQKLAVARRWADFSK
jgi:hypothetical protein